MTTPELTETSSVIDRISAYAGKSMDKDRPRNPNITAREAIDLANYIEHLRAENERLQRRVWAV